jgi:hypothetical protein
LLPNSLSDRMFVGQNTITIHWNWNF